MSPHTIAITDDDIAYAESVLLPRAQRFDEERKTFIENLETIDLQAVPGSGKTTALLAKLLILEKHLPFEDGSGILVLSHTNAAVNEITNRIGKHCPRLFAYPNFVGTIQSFVDRFLAIPYYAVRYGRRPYAINDALYIERANRFNQTYLPNFANHERKNAWYYLYVKGIAANYRLATRDGKVVLLNNLNGAELDFTKPRGRTKTENYADFSPEEKTRVRQWLIQFKSHILEDGILHFDDAYFLANRCLIRYPRIRTLLNQRFQFVFVDEMQDMDQHQYDLLERVFYAGDASGCTYQRIGDTNQAIYSHEVKINDIWTPRDKVLPLTGSHRLSPRAADIVTPFATSPIQIDGRNTSNRDGSPNDLAPCVIVFDNATATAVLPKFCELIAIHCAAGMIPQFTRYPIRAIAWVKDKRGLRGYWPEYQAEAAKTKVSHSCLKDYVVFARQEDWQAAGLRPVHKKIMDGLLRALHLEGIRNSNSKSGYFTSRSLFKYLSETSPEFHDALRLNSFEWSRRVYSGKAIEAYVAIKDFVPALLAIFGKQLAAAYDFVDADSAATASTDTSKHAPSEANDNMYRCPVTGIEVHVGTVHSAKGETHTATLYLESKYQGKYESQRLKVCFQGDSPRFSTSPNTDVYKKQSLKMVYVGFSRPTHFLCFAVHKDRFDEPTFRQRGWEIQTVC